MINEAQDDYFLSAIKKKGFCHVSFIAKSKL